MSTGSKFIDATKKVGAFMFLFMRCLNLRKKGEVD